MFLKRVCEVLLLLLLLVGLCHGLLWEVAHAVGARDRVREQGVALTVDQVELADLSSFHGVLLHGSSTGFRVYRAFVFLGLFALLVALLTDGADFGVETLLRILALLFLDRAGCEALIL